MTESTPASILDGLTFEAVEWLPSGADTGLVRVRGRWSPGAARPEGLPVLCASVGGGVSRYESLPDAPTSRQAHGSVWRGAYLLPEAIARSGVWLEWQGGERSALPVPAGLDERAAPAALSAVEEEPEAPGGEVIDHAVMADRRARRAEAAEQAQARVASEALRALDALERRGSELEARVEALAAERDALAERAADLEPRTPRDEHQRAALADALAAAATARRRARDWQLRMRAAEVARSSDAVRLRVLEAREAGSALLRAERAEQAAALQEARDRAAALDAEAGRAREQAVAAANDLDDVRRDFARRLEEGATELAGREAELSAARTELEDVRAELSEARAYAERAIAEAHAAGEAQVAETRAAAEQRVRAAQAELSDARAEAEAQARAAQVELSDARAEAEAQARAAQAELADAHAEAAQQARAAATELDDTRRQLADLRADLEAERAARVAAGAAAETARGEAAIAVADLRAERVARASLADELQRERAARSALSDALDAETAALASLHVELNVERAAREADQAELAELRARLADTDREGGLLDRVAELDRRAAGLADELELQRRAREQAEAAAAARGTEEESSRVVADLDAAASALRERAANGTTPDAPAPGEDVVSAPDVAEARAEADAAIAPAAAPPERERRAIVSASSAPVRAHATGGSQRQYPWLRGALVKLAHDDPQAAGKLIAGLLPAQAVIVQSPVDYDLTIAEIGTFAVTVAGGRAYVKEIAEPRGRRQAEFHLSAGALALAELIAGVPHRISRFRGPVRVTGRKRRHKPLKAITATRLSLAEAARSGARLEPGLVFRTFPYVIHAAWSRDHRFTVAQRVTTEPPGTWYVTVGNGQGIRVQTTEPEGGADATVTMTPEGFGHLLRGEPVPPGHRPVVRGDREAVALLKAWIDRAQAS